MIITLTPPQNITSIDVGTSTPKLGGVIDVSDFTNLQLLYCTNNDLTEVNGYADNPNMVNFRISGNKLSTSLPSLIGMSNMETFYCNGNQITGSFPNITGLSNLIIFNIGNNEMSGTLPPDLSTLGLTSLDRFNIFQNNFSDTLPSFSGTTVQRVLCNDNNFSDFTGGVPIDLYIFEAYNNNLTQTAVDNILQAFVNANRQTPTNDMSQASINLSGTGNAAPSSQTNVTILRNRGWEVSTN